LPRLAFDSVKDAGSFGADPVIRDGDQKDGFTVALATPLSLFAFQLVRGRSQEIKAYS